MCIQTDITGSITNTTIARQGSQFLKKWAHLMQYAKICIFLKLQEPRASFQVYGALAPLLMFETVAIFLPEVLEAKFSACV